MPDLEVQHQLTKRGQVRYSPSMTWYPIWTPTMVPSTPQVRCIDSYQRHDSMSWSWACISAYQVVVSGRRAGARREGGSSRPVRGSTIRTTLVEVSTNVDLPVNLSHTPHNLKRLRFGSGKPETCCVTVLQTVIYDMHVSSH